MKLRPGYAGTTSFSGRGLLDFNVLFGEWPSNLPPAPASLPSPPVKSAFALLKEGQAWLHTLGRLLVVAQQEVDCDGQVCRRGRSRCCFDHLRRCLAS